MSEAKEVKRQDDLVRLFNKTDSTQRSNFDGSVYEIEPQGETVLRRDIAEHLIKKTSSMTQTGRSYTLEIAELPIGQRQKSPGEFPKMTQENARLEQENKLLKEKIKEVVAQNEALEAEIKKLKKK